jgi:predicted MFS family arabinose efflux permease
MTKTTTAATVDPSSTFSAPRPAESRPTVVLLVLSLSAFAVVVMQSMVMPVLGGLAEVLRVSMTDVTWVVTVNMLAAAVFTPLLGALGDRLGRKRVLLVTLALTTAGSVLVAASTSFWLVLVGRALQGTGFAVMSLAIGIVRSVFPPERVPSGIALLSALTGIGAGAGLLASGALVRIDFSVQGMFWIAAAVTAVGLIGTAVLIRLPEKAKPYTLDVFGLTTLTGGLVCLVLAINRGPTWGWGSARVLGLLAGGLVLLVGWWHVERRVREPLVDVGMMRTPVVLGTNIATFLVGAGMYGAFILIVQFVQTSPATGYGFGADALDAGLTLLPLTVGTLLATYTVPVLIRRVNAKLPMIIGTVVATATFAFLLAFHHQHWHFYLAAGLLGLGLGLAFGTIPTLLNQGVGPAQTSVANSINQTLRSVGGSIGTAAASAILAASVVNGLPTVGSYTTAFALSAVICVLAVIAAVLIPFSPTTSATAETDSKG